MKFPHTPMLQHFLKSGTVQFCILADMERIKACRVVICKKRNSPFLHLTGGHLVFAASSFASPRGRWHRGAYLYLCLVATLRWSHWLRGHLPHHHQLCRQTSLYMDNSISSTTQAPLLCVGMPQEGMWIVGMTFC